jgi:hypothetical protein
MVVYDPHLDCFKQTIGSRRTFAWFPEQCYNSGKRIWLERCYVSTILCVQGQYSIFLDRWYTEHEFLIAKLKGDV